jgi:hypothetical protein
MNDKIDQILLKNKDLLLGKHNSEDFKKLIKKMFKKYRVKVHIIPVFQDMGISLLTFGGGYNEETDTIDLDFFVTDSVDGTLFLAECYWSEFSFKVSQLLQHELIHRKQAYSRDRIFESRKYKVQKDASGDREYLSDSDEIDAYSHDIAMEIIKYYKNSEKNKIFSEMSQMTHLESFILYKNAFKCTNWNKIYKKLMKKTYKWVEYYAF